MSAKIIAIAAVAILVVAGVGVAIYMANDKGDSSGDRVGEELSKDNYPSSASRLWVYGNANEDDKIDGADITALEKMVNGEMKATQLADTNVDGKIDSKDVDYLKDIIDAKSDTKIKVYYVDNYFKIAKVSWPVKTIGTTYCSGLYTAETTGLTNKITLIDDTIKNYWAKLNSNLANAMSMSDTDNPNYEKIIESEVSVYVPGWCNADVDPTLREKLEPAGIDVMFMNTCDNSGVDVSNEYIDRSIIMFGYLLQGDMTKTYDYLTWHDGIMTKIKTAAAAIPDNEKKALIMSRNAPSYIENDKFSLTGVGNTNMIHASWAGCYVVADHYKSDLPKNYNTLNAEGIATLLHKLKTDGISQVYWMDNEHDGLRGQRDLSVTLHSWYVQHSNIAEAIPTIEYLGMAREAGNSPLYIIEMAFYYNALYGALDGVNFTDLFNYWIDHFTTEKDKYTAAGVDINEFFKDFGPTP